MTKDKRYIPKKFKKANKSFVNRILTEKERSSLIGFDVFPRKVNFYGKDPEEDVVLIVRRHWIAFVPPVLLSLLVVCTPFIYLLLTAQIASFSFVLYLGIWIVALILSFNMIVTTALRWHYTVNLITDERIVCIRMDNAFYHSYSEAQLEKIEDITHTHVGILGGIFDFGDVQIDTAGHDVDFKLRTIPRPRELQDVLNDLLEMKQKGDI